MSRSKRGHNGWEVPLRAARDKARRRSLLKVGLEFLLCSFLHRKYGMHCARELFLELGGWKWCSNLATKSQHSK